MEFIPIQICNIGKFIDALVIMMRFKYILNFELIEYKSVFIFFFLLISSCCGNYMWDRAHFKDLNDFVQKFTILFEMISIFPRYLLINFFLRNLINLKTKIKKKPEREAKSFDYSFNAMRRGETDNWLSQIRRITSWEGRQTLRTEMKSSGWCSRKNWI